MSKWGSWEALGARLAREQTVFVSLAVAYLITGKGGLALSYGHPAVSLVFPPAGLALGAFLVFGYRIWPIVFGAAAVMYASTWAESCRRIIRAPPSKACSPRISSTGTRTDVMRCRVRAPA